MPTPTRSLRGLPSLASSTIEGSGHPNLFWDERRGFFRFADSTFALSREHANWSELKARGFFKECGL
ncbi:MAG: hypothetical protein M3Q60_22550 [Actinomycetota bacterium]|jgi:hypothetical protein|nr:hypothetical protein [Actinomycetota bacterium]